MRRGERRSPRLGGATPLLRLLPAELIFGDERVEKIIGRIAKNRHQQLCITLTRRDGHAYCLVRNVDDPDEELVLEAARLPQLIEALERAKAEAQAAGLAEPELPLLEPELAGDSDLTMLSCG